MNRPSRTEDDLLHPTWNQNPPFLAPDLTTCEDFNGNINARVLKNAAGGGSASALSLLGERSQFFSDGPVEPGECSPLRLETVPFQERLQHLFCRLTNTKVWGWTWWIVSVLATSSIMSTLGLTNRTADPPVPVAAGPAPAPSPPARLYRRDECESNSVRSEDYDVPLHVGALIIIMFVSTLACLFPLIAQRIPRLRIPDAVFFTIRHFGTGVLIATAFVHLLPTAFECLNDPCLGAFWTEDYQPMPGAIALVGVFFVIVIEMVFSPARHFPSCPAPGAAGTGNRFRGSLDGSQAGTPAYRRSVEVGQQDDQVTPQGQLTPRNADGGGAAGLEPKGAGAGAHGVQDAEMLTPAHFLTEDQKLKKHILQCVLLEVGILFHSVFIGMALSVSIGSEFVILLIAIAFHQTFEGLALGSRIADIDWSSHPARPWIMCIAYGLTTPIGQAIGLATHTLYSPDSAFGLILVGTMNAISAGLLVYASLVELVAVDFLSDESWEVLRGKRRVLACLILLAGAFCMALVGAWA